MQLLRMRPNCLSTQVCLRQAFFLTARIPHSHANGFGVDLDRARYYLNLMKTSMLEDMLFLIDRSPYILLVNWHMTYLAFLCINPNICQQVGLVMFLKIVIFIIAIASFSFPSALYKRALKE